jgi:hypothetical protein
MRRRHQCNRRSGWRPRDGVRIVVRRTAARSSPALRPLPPRGADGMAGRLASWSDCRRRRGNPPPGGLGHPTPWATARAQTGPASFRLNTLPGQLLNSTAISAGLTNAACPPPCRSLRRRTIRTNSVVGNGTGGWRLGPTIAALLSFNIMAFGLIDARGAGAHAAACLRTVQAGTVAQPASRRGMAYARGGIPAPVS